METRITIIDLMSPWMQLLIPALEPGLPLLNPCDNRFLIFRACALFSSPSNVKGFKNKCYGNPFKNGCIKTIQLFKKTKRHEVYFLSDKFNWRYNNILILSRVFWLRLSMRARVVPLCPRQRLYNVAHRVRVWRPKLPTAQFLIMIKKNHILLQRSRWWHSLCAYYYSIFMHIIKNLASITKTFFKPYCTTYLNSWPG